VSNVEPILLVVSGSFVHDQVEALKKKLESKGAVVLVLTGYDNLHVVTQRLYASSISYPNSDGRMPEGTQSELVFTVSGQYDEDSMDQLRKDLEEKGIEATILTGNGLNFSVHQLPSR
jgi:hypothetical protein